MLNRFSAAELDNFNANGMNLLQKSCNYGLEEFAILLLEHGADPNKTIEECGTPPVLFAGTGYPIWISTKINMYYCGFVFGV